MSKSRQATILKFDELKSPRTEAMIACLELVEKMSPEEREVFLTQLTVRLRAVPVPKAGNALKAVSASIPRDREWSIKELKTKVEEAFSGVSEKEIYNAVAYLTRRNQIVRVGQGRYIINGIAVVSSDDLGGNPLPNEGDLNDY